MVGSDDVDFIKRKASYKDMEPREYCIWQIRKWRKNLEQVSEDYRELSESEFDILLDKEIMERNNE